MTNHYLCSIFYKLGKEMKPLELSWKMLRRRVQRNGNSRFHVGDPYLVISEGL